MGGCSLDTCKYDFYRGIMLVPSTASAPIIAAMRVPVASSVLPTPRHNLVDGSRPRISCDKIGCVITGQVDVLSPVVEVYTNGTACMVHRVDHEEPPVHTTDQTLRDVNTNVESIGNIR